MQKKRHGGYTLIEILVAFAVLGIAILGIGGFFVSASRSYSSVSEETSLQYEAQLALNQMENMLIDSALGVSYNYVTSADESSGGYHFVENDGNVSGNPAAVSKVLYVFNINETPSTQLDILMMKWVAEKKSIYYTVKSVPNSDQEIKAIDISGTGGDWDLLAEDVVEFSVDLSDYKNTKKVNIDLGIEKRSKEYHTTGTIILRNDILINEPSVSKIYEHISLLIRSEITGLELRANTTVTIPGGIVQLYAKVLGTGYPNQRIHRWMIASDQGFNSVIYDSDVDYTGVGMPKAYIDTNTHTLYVTNQTAGMPETLYVKAFVNTVDDEGNSTTISAWIPIGIKVINDIVVSVAADTNLEENGNLTGTFSLAKLSEQRVNAANVPTMNLSHKNVVQMTAAVSASNTITAEERAISWSVHSADPGVTASIDTSGQLKISQYSRTGTCVVRATLKLDRSVYVDYIVNVVTEYGSTDTLEIIPSKTSINRGGNTDCSLKLNGAAVDNKDYNWSVSVVNSQGQQINGTPVVVNAEGGVYANYELSYDYAYDVWIKATLKSNSNVTGTTKITIPKVTITLTPDNSYTVMGAKLTGFTCVAIGLEDYDIAWSMAKDLNPHYFFTAWGNFNITGVKLPNGSATAEVVMGSSSDPMTNCTVKAQLKNNTNYSASTRIITKDVKMNLSGINSKSGATGVNVVSRASSLQMKVSLSKADPNISVSNNSVNWEIVNVKVDGAVKPELLDDNISISDTGLLSLSKDFAKNYNTKNVTITVRAWETVYGLEGTRVVTVPTLTYTGATSIGRGTSGTLSVGLSATDPNITIDQNAIKWTVTKVSHDSSKNTSISGNKLTVGKAFAISNRTSTSVTVTVTGVDEVHNLKVSSTIKVPVVSISPWDSEKKRIYRAMVPEGTTTETVIQMTCPAAVSWYIGGSDGNPVECDYATVDDTGKVTLKKNDNMIYGYEPIRYAYVKYSNGEYQQALLLFHGFLTQESLQTNYYDKLKEHVQTVNANGIAKYTYISVESSYRPYAGNGSFGKSYCVLQKIYYEGETEPVEKYYAYVSTTNRWYLRDDENLVDGNKVWIDSTAPDGWTATYFTDLGNK